MEHVVKLIQIHRRGAMTPEEKNLQVESYVYAGITLIIFLLGCAYMAKHVNLI